MGGEEGLAVKLEVPLVLVEQAIEPGQQLLGAVVGVQDDGDTVGGSDATDVVSTGDTTGNGGLLLAVGDTLERNDQYSLSRSAVQSMADKTYLASEVGGTTVGELQNDGAVLVTGSLEGSDNGRRGGDVLVPMSVIHHKNVLR